MKSLFILSVGLSLLGCSGKQVLKMREEINESAKDLTLSIIWIKNKKDSVDIKFKLYNGYGHPVHMDKESFKLTYNGRPGTLHEDQLEISMPSKAFHEQYLMFRYANDIPPTGDAVLTIDPIYKGHTADGNKTKLAKFTRSVTFTGK